MIKYCRLLMLLIATPAWAVQFEQDSRYIYQVAPWKQALEAEGQLDVLAKASLRVMDTFLAQQIEDGSIPRQLVSLKDLRELTVANSNIGAAIREINNWINEQKSDTEFWRVTKTLPDALIVFFGGKFGINLSVGGGGSMVMGLVVQPLWVKRIDKLTKETIQYFTAKTSLVAWGAGNVGVAVGGGGSLRVGLGLVWGSDFFTNPSQFVGYGLGASLGANWGLGLNLKAGMLNNPKMPGMLDFVYATAAWEMGVEASAGAHANGTIVLPMSKLMEMFDTATSNVMTRQEQILQQQIEEQLRKEMGLPEPKKGHDWDFGINPGFELNEWR